MRASKVIRVLIVDDHPLVRSGIKDFIAVYDWMKPVGEAQNGVEAVEFCSTHEVDVVLMDLVMPLVNGSEATQRIVALDKGIKVIVITNFYEQDLVRQALKAGATSYLLKNVNADELADAIQAAHGGYSMFAPEATRALIEPSEQKSGVNFGLTGAERKILAALAGGASNLEISEQFSISVATVKYHLTNIFSKLGVRNRVEAATIALENNLVEKGNPAAE